MGHWLGIGALVGHWGIGWALGRTLRLPPATSGGTLVRIRVRVRARARVRVRVGVRVRVRTARSGLRKGRSAR